MNVLTDNPAALVAVGLALVGLLAIWRSGRNSAARAAGQVREVTRMGGTFLSTVLIAAVIGGIQWAVVAHTSDRTALLMVLGVPALLAGITVARLFAVTTVIQTRNGGK
jgi:hypothetical protein